jgi:hypothetical protein
LQCSPWKRWPARAGQIPATRRRIPAGDGGGVTRGSSATGLWAGWVENGGRRWGAPAASGCVRRGPCCGAGGARRSGQGRGREGEVELHARKRVDRPLYAGVRAPDSSGRTAGHPGAPSVVRRSVGDSPRGPLKRRGNPHLKPTTRPKHNLPNHAGNGPCRRSPDGPSRRPS